MEKLSLETYYQSVFKTTVEELNLKLSSEQEQTLLKICYDEYLLEDE